MTWEGFPFFSDLIKRDYVALCVCKANAATFARLLAAQSLHSLCFPGQSYQQLTERPAGTFPGLFVISDCPRTSGWWQKGEIAVKGFSLTLTSLPAPHCPFVFRLGLCFVFVFFFFL